jgi:hypothetical protein
VLPASDSARLAEAGKVYALVGDQIRRGRVPSPQLVLMSVSANMPALADRILASARTRYVVRRSARQRVPCLGVVGASSSLLDEPHSHLSLR